MINIRSKREIDLLRESGKILSLVHKKVRENLREGITTLELDKMIYSFIKENNAIPSFKGLYGFPASSCISINEELIHGIPSNKVIKDGDLISIDIGVYKNGYHSDAARSYIIGEKSDSIKKDILEHTIKSFYESLKVCKEGYRVYDISSAIQTYIESKGYSLPTEFTGHGVGTELHEDPAIPNVGKAGTGSRLRKGMVIAIEPMVNFGTAQTVTLDDGWTVVTKDGAISAHYENTLVITDGEPEILTNFYEEL